MEHLLKMDFLGKSHGQLVPTGVNTFSEPSVTIMVDGEPVASGGLLVSWGTMAEVWLYLSSRAGRIAIIETRLQLYRWIEQYKLKRVQACVREDWTKACRFAEWMGFMFEGRMRNFGPDCKTYNLYAVVI